MLFEGGLYLTRTVYCNDFRCDLMLFEGGLYSISSVCWSRWVVIWCYLKVGYIFAAMPRSGTRVVIWCYLKVGYIRLRVGIRAEIVVIWCYLKVGYIIGVATPLVWETSLIFFRVFFKKAPIEEVRAAAEWFFYRQKSACRWIDGRSLSKPWQYLPPEPLLQPGWCAPEHSLR